MALWTPAEITTALWLDASDTSTLTMDGAGVEQWDDKSGNLNHFTVPSSFGQPTMNSANLALGAVRFDGASNTRMVGSRPATGAAALTIYAVVYRAASAGKGILFGDTSTSTSRFLLAIENSTGDWIGDVTSSSAYVNGTVASSPNRKTFYDALNGNTAVLAMLGTISANWGSTFALSGYYTSESTWGMRGDVGEIVIVTGSASDTDRYKVEGYLAHKWGLEANLPVGHPYEDAAPSIGSDIVSSWQEPYNIGYEAQISSYVESWHTISDYLTPSYAEPMAYALLASWREPYRSTPQHLAFWREFYTAAPEYVRSFNEPYISAAEILAAWREEWTEQPAILAAWVEPYRVADATLLVSITEPYSLEELSQLMPHWKELYAMTIGTSLYQRVERVH